MVNISKFGDSAIKFKFTDNDHYLFNGEIEVPINSLLLVLDESDMVTFKKIDGDPFVSFLISNSNFASKNDLENFYIANMVGSGNSESGITSGDVESMIEASLQDYYDIDEIDAALSGKADSSAVTEAINSAVSGKADTSAVTESINAAVSGKADTSSVYTKSEVDTALSGKADSSSVYTKSEVDTALSAKQDTLVAGDNITISGNVISADGGGKAVSGGTNISITTGETADTINCTLPIKKIQGYSSVIIGDSRNNVQGDANVAIGFQNSIVAKSGSYIPSHCFVSGKHNNIINDDEAAFGKYNNSVQNTSVGGESGTTLFSVGNGTANNARHNAFEIKKNGDIYIVDTNNTSTTDYYQKPMIKLQDALGGGSIDIDPSLDSGSTNAVANSAITSQFNSIDARLSEDEEVTAAALNALNDGKQDTLIAGSGITISGNVISAEGGNLVIELTQAEYDALVDKDPNAFYIITDATEINISDYYTSAQTQSAINAAVSGKQDTLIAGSGITISGNVISANGGGGSITVDTALDSGSTNPVENRVIYDKFDEVEQVTAAALNALNDNFDGLRLKKLTQAEYEALTVKDNNTLYILVG